MDQKTYLDKVDRSGPKPRVPDPVRHFVATWWPFWIFEVLTEEMVELRNLFYKS